jgi:branched-chain amino acid transport system ATP-binding protein
MLAVSDLRARIGRVPVLRGVNLSVGEGETVALLGRNGVGKTSTLRASLGIGYVPQGRGVFPLLTVEENLFLGLRGAPPGDLVDEIYARFPRLAERRHQAAGTLSGGEQQILAIARCLVMRPSLIMLDEPTEGIMPKLVAQIRHEIADIARRGVSVLIVEQNIRTALRLASRVYLMEKGLVVHEATPDRLKADPATVHRFLGVSL